MLNKLKDYLLRYFKTAAYAPDPIPENRAGTDLSPANYPWPPTCLREVIDFPSHPNSDKKNDAITKTPADKATFYCQASDLSNVHPLKQAFGWGSDEYFDEGDLVLSNGDVIKSEIIDKLADAYIEANLLPYIDVEPDEYFAAASKTVEFPEPS